MKRRWQVIAGVLCAAGLVHTTARAESHLVLPYPNVFETVSAATYDSQRDRVGDAHVVLERLEDRNVRMIAESGFDGGARNVVEAVLEPVRTGDGQGLRLLHQESRSFDARNRPLGVLTIDHRAGTGSCRRPDGSLAETIELPSDDRVANVPLNLLFLPLVQGSADTLDYQVFVCRGGARLVDFEARVAERTRASHGHGPLVKVRYGPDFGGVASIFARNFLPHFSVWFDPRQKSPWIAHRIPLYARGPEVLVVRDGFPLLDLGGD